MLPVDARKGQIVRFFVPVVNEQDMRRASPESRTQRPEKTASTPSTGGEVRPMKTLKRTPKAKRSWLLLTVLIAYFFIFTRQLARDSARSIGGPLFT
jgi:hypothetical protein